jgi:lipoyl-dependent peroxiredoxin
MKPYARKASVLWLGTRQRGKGAISTPSAALKMALHAAGGGTKRQGTSPPELIAAAHAGSFSLTLANELGEAGYSPRQIDTTATVTMENIAAVWTMTQIHLDVVAAVPRVAQCDFVDAALRAKANCPVSRALNANISMRAKLSYREAPLRILPHRNSGALGPGKGRKNRARRNGAPD